MIIMSILLICAGVASIIYGTTLNNSIEAQLEAAFNSGYTDPGTVWIIIGGVLAVVGVILLIVDLMKRNGSGSGSVIDKKPIIIPEPQNGKVCPACKRMQEAEARYCRFCGIEIIPAKKPDPKPEDKPERKSDGKAICPYCGARQSADQTHCKYCKTPMR